VDRSQQALLGYEGAIWNPADPSNYNLSNRGVSQITEIVVHTMEGYYGGSQSWFKNPSADVSAHYLVQSSDGEITQMVDDSDRAWHVICLNDSAIGIEHEGFVGEGATWYTDEMYRESAKLTAWLSNQYLVDLDREHIIGHDETGCTTHTDPGSMWDWPKYMQLVEQFAVRTHGAELVSIDAPERLVAGDYENVTIVLRNAGNYTWAQDEVLLGTQSPQDHASEFSSSFWPAGNRAGGANAVDNYAGEEIAFVFPIQAPTLPQTMMVTETLQLTDADGNWFGPEIEFSVEVVAGDPGEDPGDSGGCGCSTPGGSVSVWGLLFLVALLPLRRRHRSGL
jgi:MYXO-CTERM domain-containing protein